MKKRLIVTAKVVISLSLLGYMLSQLEWQSLIDTASRLAWWTLPAAVLLLFLTLVFGTLRWELLLKTHYSYFRLLSLFRHYLVATLFNNLLPSSTGGDLIRSYSIYRHNRDAVCAVSPVITERVIGLVVLLAINVIAIYISHAVDVLGHALWSTLLLALAGMVIVLTLIALPSTYWPLHRRLERLAGFRVIAFILRMGEATHGYLKRPDTLMMMIVYSIIAQLIAVFTYSVLAAGLDIAVPIDVMLVVIPLALMAAALPVTIGGIGVRELAMAQLLVRFGVERTDAAAIALLYIPVLLLASLPGLYIFITESGQRRLLKEAEESRIG